MGGEAGGGVHAVGARIVVAEGLGHDDVRIFQAALKEVLAPALDGGEGIGEDGGAVEHEERPAIDADVAGVGEEGLERGGEVTVVFDGVLLLHEDLGVFAVPATGPALVGPVDAEGHIEVGHGEQVLQRGFEQAAAVEPVVMEAEAVYAVAAGEGDLAAKHVGRTEVVEAELARQARLIVSDEAGYRLGDVGPLGEALAPPRVVFGNCVELREVIGDEPDLTGGGREGDGRVILKEGAGPGIEADLIE